MALFTGVRYFLLINVADFLFILIFHLVTSLLRQVAMTGILTDFAFFIVFTFRRCFAGLLVHGWTAKELNLKFARLLDQILLAIDAVGRLLAYFLGQPRTRGRQ